MLSNIVELEICQVIALGIVPETIVRIAYGGIDSSAIHQLPDEPEGAFTVADPRPNHLEKFGFADDPVTTVPVNTEKFRKCFITQNSHHFLPSILEALQLILVSLLPVNDIPIKSPKRSIGKEFPDPEKFSVVLKGYRRDPKIVGGGQFRTFASGAGVRPGRLRGLDGVRAAGRFRPARS